MPNLLNVQIDLNIAQIWPATRTLGPGLRSVVWVQGCPRNCPECISPEWIPQTKNTIMKPQDVAALLLANTNVEGITFSGGEPMLQAAGLSELAQAARKQRDINFICFTGYTYQQLLDQPSSSSVHKLLAELDVLIDGPYIASQDNGRGMRGSTNQKVYHLTERLRGHDFETGPRSVEVHIQDNYAMMVGVPTREVLQVIDQTMESKGFRKK